MQPLKSVVKRIPIVGPTAQRYVAARRKKAPLKRPKIFPGTLKFWEWWYAHGGSSGAGSYGELAQFKAEVLNALVTEYQIQSVIEFGCGDGNQLSLAQYPTYIGLDISQSAIKLCISKFKNDPTKSFFVYVPDGFVDNMGVFQADLAISLEVIFHLMEDNIYETYLRHLFASAKRYVIIFSSNVKSGQLPEADFVKHHCFSDWVDTHVPEWVLIRKIDNKYPFDLSAPVRSVSDFYVYEKKTDA